eukprot:GHVS01018623.1.p2 GENE.GHVS01018623.1~~GHVS01018623.1.p2  ORF type:complete len:360 (+),score=69.09 GHVS01018623.1:62-1141(+)
MIGTEHFWEEEAEAPLLNRNAGYLSAQSAAEALDRANQFSQLTEGFCSEVVHVDILPDCHDEAALRIFRLDAERTFSSPHHRTQMIAVLRTLWHEMQDYHQGLGFIVAYLLLYLPPQEVVNICITLHRHYVPGYYKSAAVAYVRDAKVFWKLVRKFFPHVSTHLENTAPPEAFCSKWFVGLCVHVLPFRALMLFLEQFFSNGVEFLMKFGLALIQNCEGDIMATSQVSRILAILRLDVTEYDDLRKVAGDDDKEEGSFFMKIVEDAMIFSLDGVCMDELRADVLEEMQLEEANRKKREAEMGPYSDDEIVFSDEEEEGQGNDEEEDEADDENCNTGNFNGKIASQVAAESSNADTAKRK